MSKSATLPAKPASLTVRRRAKTLALAGTLAAEDARRALLLDCLLADTAARLALVTRLAMRAEGPQAGLVRDWLWAFADDPQAGVARMAQTALQTVFDVPAERLEAQALAP